ncbi:MAG: aminotransferase class I/II-fold pyridoxal phosphate-dependent enzyme, partial [Planctomycetota bacterium]
MSNAPPPRTITPAARLRGLRPYAPEPADTAIDLRLDANEGVQPGPDVLDALQAITPEQLRRYPNAAPLESELAASFGVDPSRIIVTNGGDDAIDRVCRAVLEPGRELLTHSPSFVMIPRSAKLAGADVRTIPWTTGAFPAADFVSHVSNQTGLIALVTPNNPTGRVIDTPTILRIARAAAGAGSLALIDLAYIEFADEDPTPLLLDEPNIVMIRTMSKAAGLAGARVGYAIAPTEVADWLRTVGAPFPVSSASL